MALDYLGQRARRAALDRGVHFVLLVRGGFRLL
jgi:hypothetical protein